MKHDLSPSEADWGSMQQATPLFTVAGAPALQAYAHHATMLWGLSRDPASKGCSGTRQDHLG